MCRASRTASVEDVKAAADIVEVVVDAHGAAPASGARYTGRCPFHEERTPSFSVNPVREALLLLRLRQGRRRRSRSSGRPRTSTSSARSSGSPSGSASRSSTRRRSPEDGARAARANGSTQLLEQAAAFYERYLWESQRGRARARLPRRRAGSARRSAASSGSGSRPAARRSRAKARERGLHARRAARRPGSSTRRGNDYFPPRLMFPLADAPRPRRRLPGAQAARGRPAARQVRQLARGRALPQGRRSSTGSTSPAPAIAKQDRAVVVEGNTDVIALRQAGLEPVVASMGTALTERQLRELGRLTRRALPLLRRRRGRRGGDAARDGARGRRRASTSGS